MKRVTQMLPTRETLRSSFQRWKVDLLALSIFILLPFLVIAGGLNPVTHALGDGDALFTGVPAKYFIKDFSTWNDKVALGISHGTQIGFQAFYPPAHALMAFFSPVLGYNLSLLLHYTASGFFTFLLLRTLGLSFIPGLFGGISFMFCGFLVSHLGHHSMMNAGVWLPLVLYFLEKFFKDRGWIHLSFAATAFSMSILADYPAVALYTGMVAFPYILVRSWTTSSPRIFHSLWKTVWISGVVFGGALALSSLMVLPILESLPLSDRQRITYEFFSGYSFSWSLLPIILFPYFYGTNTPSPLFPSGYIGPWNLTEMTAYMGILPVILALSSLFFFRKNRWLVALFTLVAAGGALLALGSSFPPLAKIMFQVPVYNMFRVPARNWFEVNFAVSILAAFALHHLLPPTGTLLAKFSKTGVLVSGLLVLLVIGMTFSLAVGFSKIIPMLDTAKLQTLPGDLSMNFPASVVLENLRFVWGVSRPALFLPLLFAGLSLLLLTLALAFPRHRKVLGLSFLLLLVLDLGIFANHYNFRKYSLNFKATLNLERHEIASFLKKREPGAGTGRVLPLEVGLDQISPSLNFIPGIQMTGGYLTSWSKNFIHLTSFAANGISTEPRALLENNTVLNITSTRYLTTRVKGSVPQEVFPRPMETTAVDLDFSWGPAWATYSAEVFPGSRAVLSLGAGAPFSLIQRPIALSAGQYVKISFLVSNHGSTPASMALDLFGTGYDFVDQQRDFTVQPEASRHISFLLPSGPNPPKDAVLRVSTYTSPGKVTVLNPMVSIVRPVKGNAEQIYRPVFTSRDGVTVFENTRSHPRARFVTQVIPLKDPEEIKDRLWDDTTLDTRTTALVEGKGLPRTYQEGEILESQFANQNHLGFKVRTKGPSFFVLSDTHYPGWKAYVDGVPVPISRVYGIVRGIEIQSAGEHKIEFKFASGSIRAGAGISLAALLILFGIPLGGFFLSRSRRKV